MSFYTGDDVIPVVFIYLAFVPILLALIIGAIYYHAIIKRNECPLFPPFDVKDCCKDLKGHRCEKIQCPHFNEG